MPVSRIASPLRGRGNRATDAGSRSAIACEHLPIQVVGARDDHVVVGAQCVKNRLRRLGVAKRQCRGAVESDHLRGCVEFLRFGAKKRCSSVEAERRRHQQQRHAAGEHHDPLKFRANRQIAVGAHVSSLV